MYLCATRSAEAIPRWKARPELAPAIEYVELDVELANSNRYLALASIAFIDA